VLLGENEKERSDAVSSSTRSDRKRTVEKKKKMIKSLVENEKELSNLD